MPLNQPPQVYTEAMQEKIHGFTRGDRVGWLQIHGAKVCETSFSHHFHVIFTDPWPTLCHAVPRFEVSGKFLELAPSTSLGFWCTIFHIVPGDDFT